VIVNRVIKNVLLSLSIKRPEELQREGTTGEKLRKSIDKHGVRSMGLLNGPHFEPFLRSKERKESLAHLSIIPRPSINFRKTYYSRYIHCFALDILTMQRVQMQFFLITSSRVCADIYRAINTPSTRCVHGYIAKSKVLTYFFTYCRSMKYDLFRTTSLNTTEIDNNDIFEN